MSNVAALYKRASADTLPNPFSAKIIEAMAADLERAMSDMPAEAGEAARTAAIIHVVSIWTCRAARLYASDRDDELRADVSKLYTALVQEVENLRSRCEFLDSRLYVVEQERTMRPASRP